MSYAVEKLVAQAGPLSDHPEPELPKRSTRRRFDPAYKLAILDEWDRATDAGEKSAILRREGLYSSVISDWRRQRREGLLVDPARRVEGRGGPSYAEVDRLRRENTRLQKELEKAQFVIEVQGKVSALLGELSKSADSEQSETASSTKGWRSSPRQPASPEPAEPSDDPGPPGTDNAAPPRRRRGSRGRTPEG